MEIWDLLPEFSPEICGLSGLVVFYGSGLKRGFSVFKVIGNRQHVETIILLLQNTRNRIIHTCRYWFVAINKLLLLLICQICIYAQCGLEFSKILNFWLKSHICDRLGNTTAVVFINHPTNLYWLTACCTCVLSYTTCTTAKTDNCSCTKQITVLWYWTDNSTTDTKQITVLLILNR